MRDVQSALESGHLVVEEGCQLVFCVFMEKVVLVSLFDSLAGRRWGGEQISANITLLLSTQRIKNKSAIQNLARKTVTKQKLTSRGPSEFLPTTRILSASKMPTAKKAMPTAITTFFVFSELFRVLSDESLSMGSGWSMVVGTGGVDAGGAGVLVGLVRNGCGED